MLFFMNSPKCNEYDYISFLMRLREFSVVPKLKKYNRIMRAVRHMIRSIVCFTGFHPTQKFCGAKLPRSPAGADF